MPEENQLLSKNEVARLRALYSGNLPADQAEELNAELFNKGNGRIVSDSNYSLGIANSIFDIVRNQLSSNDLFSAAIQAANEQRIDDAKSLAAQALEVLDSGSSEAGAIYVFIAQLSLQHGNLAEFKRVIDEQLKNAGAPIPLWKRLGDLGVVYHEDDASVPPEAIEEVFQMALDEFHSAPPKKKSFLTRTKQLRTKLFPALFNFIPSEYDEVRLNFLLANAARKQRHFRRAINHLEEAKTVCDRILVEKQAEYAKFLSDYSFQKLLLCSALGNWKGMNAIVDFTKRSLTLAGFSKHFPRTGFDYNTIDRNYIISAYVFSSRSTKSEKLAWIIISLESILDRIDREDERCVELVETIQADLEMIHARQVEFEILPLVSLKIA